MSSSQRPEWVPDWAWQGLQQIDNIFLRIEREDDGRSQDMAEYRAVSEAIAQSEDCRIVWEAMSRRNAGVPERARDLLFFAAVNTNKPVGAYTIPASERKKHGTKIAKKAKELREELEWLKSAGRGFFPLEWTPSIYEGKEKRERYDFQVQGNNLIDALVQIEEAVAVWKCTKPSIYRPDDPNVNRTHFIRALTDFFRGTYGTPLREQVAAITRSVFECDMNAATVKKLAP